MVVTADCETTGKLNWRKPATAPGQPRVVSIGMVAWSDDGQTELGNFYAIIRPEGFVIDNFSEACEINGITQELAMECGIPIKTALSALDQWLHRARYIGFYNADFDVQMLNGESERVGRPTQLIAEKVRCLKIAYTSLVKKAPNPGFTDYAWPKLEEAYEWLYGVKPEGAHNALHDSRLTGWLAWEAVKQGLWQWELPQLTDR